MIRFILRIAFGVFTFTWFDLANGDGIPPVLPLITQHGYPAETHKVITEDDYILTMHRIPYGTNNSEQRRGVVIILHGLHLSSADWLFIGPENALPFLLADTGYDVWLSNSRGNDQSQEHLHYDPNTSSEYWNFSWHEMGVYDLPAMIGYVLSESGESSLILIGHSQGCTETFIAGTYYPHLIGQIKAFFALAPAAYMGDTVNAYLRSMAVAEPVLKAEAEAAGYYRFSPTGGSIKDVLNITCSDSVPAIPELCWLVLAFAIDASLSGTNQTILQSVLQYTPSAISIKQNIHYGQCINSRSFRQFNYDPVKNIEVYGSLEPPKYNLSEVLFPVVIFYSINDKVTVFTDVLRTISELGNCADEHFIEDPNFAHMDFLYGINVKDLVYVPLMKEMEKFL